MKYQIADAQTTQLLDQEYNRFMRIADRQATVLLNDFRRKKNAWQLADVKFKSTGEIDFDRLTEYRTANDIFSAVGHRRKAKSHNITLFIDFSPSMSQVLGTAILQTIVLIRFAQKAKIPCQVFRQGTIKNSELQSRARESHSNTEIAVTPDDVINLFSTTNSFGVQETTLKMLFAAATFHTRSIDSTPEFEKLRKLMATDVSKIEKIESVLNDAKQKQKRNKEFTLQQEYDSFSVLTRSMTELFPFSYGTPLNSGLVAMMYVVRSFTQLTKTQNPNVLVISDGQDTAGTRTKGHLDYVGDVVFSQHSKGHIEDRLGYNYLKDGKTQNTYLARDFIPREYLASMEGAEDEYYSPTVDTAILVGMLRTITRANVSCVFICPSDFVSCVSDLTSCRDHKDRLKINYDGKSPYHVERDFWNFDYVHFISSQSLAKSFSGVEISGNAEDVLRDNSLQKKSQKAFAQDVCTMICANFK